MKKLSIITVMVVFVGIAAGAYFASESGHHAATVGAAERPGHRDEAEGSGQAEGAAKVEVVKPHKGGIERTTTQPGSVHSFESARLFSKVSGYLKKQHVDIGDEVKEGDILATIDMPELEKEVERDQAALAQAKAHVTQMEAAIATAQADYEAATALVGEREADVEHALATQKYRTKVFNRIKDLVAQSGVEQRLADEAEDNWEAAKAGLSSAKASVVSAEAQANAAKAKIDQAKADLEDAKAKVDVAEAILQKDRVFLEYTNIRSPYKGVITFRGFHPGDFINARDQGASTQLLTVDRTDKMRVVLQVPDSDVPYVNKDDEAKVEIDALPGKKFPGKVARVANSEDPTTRTMRTEVDLMNDKGQLRDGMYGKVQIILEKSSDALSVPSSALIGDTENGKGTVYVVRGGKAYKVEVHIGADDGVNVEVLSGLKPEDDVVVRPRGSLTNGVAVAVLNAK